MLLCAHSLAFTSEGRGYVRNRQAPVYGGGFVVSGYSSPMTDHLALLFLSVAVVLGLIVVAAGPRPGYHVALIVGAAPAIVALVIVLIQGVTA
jgi:hypothetical protein